MIQVRCLIFFPNFFHRIYKSGIAVFIAALPAVRQPWNLCHPWPSVRGMVASNSVAEVFMVLFLLILIVAPHYPSFHHSVSASFTTLGSGDRAKPVSTDKNGTMEKQQDKPIGTFTGQLFSS